ncbi:DUF4245 domain-containing protein [Corynebacterium pseudotuberculosis]|uniref:DUF4245 family protein n=1 Tax=Corynebacterium pseudotuberculosis (strain C231) TaxID=681645 RepID=D9Q9J5_CORP2|nr:DUF4245 domain-containing protein [Corynebacterium pseudotuberculosis]ADK28533.1 DUF4245 family protein [Corynebacterium pseudotuberculosis FRC41]ADL10221.1 DUF4245 family protein [Corynebacterium pseudotuberculosis C231]ADL20631.1 DUF4245 domain-containing protein [Corynebacterium pseudotuberculosis 1002]ADO26013.1 DUF4245 family protein [Corynebacterium pseudotuberculosis I19]AEK92071.1 Hypothetical protein CpPAT10_0737 [Corynebacterium pseudotuberculosis PAT10]
MAVEKPRIYQNGRDIVLSLGVILLVAALSIGFTGMCSFNKGTPENGPVHAVDAQTYLHLEARSMGFPVRYPGEIPGWVANSARRDDLGGTPAPVVGWVINGASFIQLEQTGLSEKDAVAAFDSNVREKTGSHVVEGINVAEYTSEEEGVRMLWVADLGDSRILVSGAAPKEQFDELISRVIKAEPISTQ